MSEIISPAGGLHAILGVRSYHLTSVGIGLSPHLSWDVHVLCQERKRMITGMKVEGRVAHQ